MFCDYLALIHVMLFMSDDLIVLVAFAGKQYYIICPMVVNRPFNCLGIWSHMAMCSVFFTLKANKYLIDYRLRLLRARIIARYDDKICIIGGNGAHYRTLRSVTISSAAKERDKSAVVIGPQCLQRVFQARRVWA